MAHLHCPSPPASPQGEGRGSSLGVAPVRAYAPVNPWIPFPSLRSAGDDGLSKTRWVRYTAFEAAS